MSSEAFQAFRCECFGDESWLRADYSLQCTTGGCPGDAGATNTPQYDEALGVAWTVIIVYAFATALGRIQSCLTTLPAGVRIVSVGFTPKGNDWAPQWTERVTGLRVSLYTR